MDVKKEPYQKALFFWSALHDSLCLQENVDPIFERSYSRKRVRRKRASFDVLIGCSFLARKGKLTMR